MSLLTNQVKPYVSILVSPTIDLTTTLGVVEKGVVFCIGKLSFGNPHEAVILNGANEQLLPLTPLLGGSLDNEMAYHISDYFNVFSGKMVVGRKLGVGSKTKIIKLKKNATNYELLASTNINVFGTNNIKDWTDTTQSADAPIELVINSCISEKHSIQMINVEGILTVKIFDRNGNMLYEVSGSSYVDGVDDYDNKNYIGILANANILTIKVKSGHADFSTDFNVVKEFTNGLVEDSGNTNYAKPLTIFENMAETCDYCITGGLSDVATVKKMGSIAFKSKVLFIIDIIGASIADAIAYKNSIGTTVEGVLFIWNRGLDVTNSGNFRLGLSGYIAGSSVKRNLSKLKDNVEYRVEGVAGVDYPLPRNKLTQLDKLTDEQLTLLYKNRINTVRYIGGKLVIGDSLSANPKEQVTRLFPLVEGKWFIDRSLAKIIESKLFKNMQEAKLFAREQTRILFKNCEDNDYMNNDVDVSYKFEIKEKDGDTIVIEYSYVPNGIVRRGIITGTIAKKII